MEGRGERAVNWRLLAAYAIALGAIFGHYAWLGVRSNGAVSFVFLFILPAFASAFVALVGGAHRPWQRGDYLKVPLVLTAATVLIGALFLREGVVCIAMLAPLWWLIGSAGVWPVYRWRRRQRPADIANLFSAHALLLVPLVALMWESVAILPVERHVVASHVVVDAPAAALWPQLASIPAVGAGEGRWTASHALLSIPRPIDARLAGSGVGAVRHGRWQGGVRFDEVVTDWRPGRAMAWRFRFPDTSLSHRVDRHLSATGPHSRVERGGYVLAPLAGGRTRVTLWTQYAIATPANGYAARWGRLLLGDIQSNILAIVAGRAERDRGAQDGEAGR